MMRAVFALIAGVCLALPAMAQSAPTDGDLTGAMANYVAMFNKGDASALAHEVYDVPGVDPAANQATLKAEIEALRRDEFGKIDLYGFTTCMVGETQARVEMRYGLLYTYGGLMPPGDQVKVFMLAKTSAGWRIRGAAVVPFDVAMSCAD